MEWDHLTEEAWLHKDVSAQLAVAQQREVKARRDMEEVHGMFQDLLTRVQRDEEVAATVRKERDELV